MTGSRYLADTNAIIAFLKGVPAAVTAFQSINTIVLCPTVYGELMFGALNSDRISQNLLRLREFSLECEIVPINFEVAEAYANLRLTLKKRGRPIPENDLWIAAVATYLQVPLITRDVHMTQIDSLEIVNF